MNSSDDRPTKQQKRPTHEDIPDVRTRTAVQQAYDNERANPGGWKEWHAKTDMKSSNDRPTKKQQKRPTHEDFPDETAVQLPSGPTYKVPGVKISLRDRSCPAVSLRDHLQGRE